MKISLTLPTLAIALGACCILASSEAIAAKRLPPVRHDVPRDSIVMSDPAILADAKSQTYYMTGTGGLLWKSKDLDKWTGPFVVAEHDTTSWMGEHPDIWAAELHEYNGKYYYFATFTNNDITIGTNRDGNIPRRASHILVSDTPDGPYRPVSDKDYLPADRPTLDGTFWVEDGKPYMIFCGEWLYNYNGTMEKIELAEDLSSAAGNPEELFRASDSPWSREMSDGKVIFSKVTDGPWLFKTGTGRLGMIWTSWVFSDYTMGVAYSDNGRVDGNWIQEPDPITPPNFGHGMIFKSLDGKYLLSAHSHANINGHYLRRPCLWEIDLSGDKLKIISKL